MRNNLILRFGDILHVDGEKCVVVSLLDKGLVGVAFEGSVFQYKEMEDFDEFKPDPVERRKESLLKLWRCQGIDFAHDHYDNQVDIGLRDLFEWLEDNKDDITTILSQ